MTKATAKRASIFDTTEYERLVQAMKDFPNFTVKILSPKAKVKSDKGLTMELMKKLVKVMSNDSQEAVSGFQKIKEDFEGTNFHFSKPKAYFLSRYPDWREWLPKVEERQAEEAQAEPVAAVDEPTRKWGFK